MRVSAMRQGQRSGRLGRPILDLTGQRFNRLTVVELLCINRRGNAMWEVRCSCGTVTIVASGNLRSGVIKSCGCLKRQLASERFRERTRNQQGKNNPNYKHGQSHNNVTPAYISWQALKKRCTDRNHDSYSYYGGRGISVSKRWLGENGFINFVSDLGPRPKNTTLDRIDNDGNYAPDNCRWATAKVQARNRQPRKERTING